MTLNFKIPSVQFAKNTQRKHRVINFYHSLIELQDKKEVLHEFFIQRRVIFAITFKAAIVANLQCAKLCKAGIVEYNKTKKNCWHFLSKMSIGVRYKLYRFILGYF